LFQSRPIVIVLDLDQQIALLHLLKIVDRHPTDIALDLGAERRHVAAKIGIVRGLPNTGADPCIPPGDEQRHDHAGQQQDSHRNGSAADPPT